MKKVLLHTIALAAIAAFFLVTLFLMKVGEVKDREITCTGLETEIRDSLGFVTKGEIKETLDSFYGNVIGQRLVEINLSKIEEILTTKSAVRKCDAWTTRDGILHIAVSQRIPVIRFQNGDQGFYADETGFAFPLQSKYTAPVPVIEGNIPMLGEGGDPKWLKGALRMVNYIQKSRRWRGFFKKMDVQGNGDFVLYPNEGKERIIFGKPDDLAGKFSRMETYYDRIKSDNPDTYRTVNVKYNGQIICRKDI